VLLLVAAAFDCTHMCTLFFVLSKFSFPLLTCASQVMIRGSTFGPLAKGTPKGAPKVLIEKSNDVQIMTNKGISAEETKVREETTAFNAEDTQGHCAAAQCCSAASTAQ